MNWEGWNRSYIHYVPSQLIWGEEGVPLVFALHGLGANAAQMELISDFNAVAEEENFIVVYPNATPNSLGDQEWNAWGNPLEPNDVNYISTLIDTFKNYYNIDLNRVYVAGSSNGGFMAYELACNLTERIAAIASVSGTMTDYTFNNCAPTKEISVMEIHGTLDFLVPYFGSPGLFTDVPVVKDYWVDWNSCAANPSVYSFPDINTTDNTTSTGFLYEQGDNNSEVYLITINGGEHGWPNAIINPTNTSKDFVPAIEIWDFFQDKSIINPVTSLTNNMENQLEIWPNPVEQQVNILTNSPQYHVEIRNLEGKLLIEKFKGQRNTINLSELQAGVYFLSIISSDIKVTKRILKL